MKKVLRRIIIILILISMGLEIILPKNISYAAKGHGDYKTIIGDGGKYFACVYQYIDGSKTVYGIWDFGDISADMIYYINDNGEKEYPKVATNGIVILEEGKKYEYLSVLSDGRKIEVLPADKDKLSDLQDVRGYYNGVYGTEFYEILEQLEEAGKKTIEELKEEAKELGKYDFLLTLYGEYLVWDGITGWYNVTLDVHHQIKDYNSLGTAYSVYSAYDLIQAIYYKDQDGKVHYPTYRIHDNTLAVYLVQNRVYYSATYVELTQIEPEGVSTLEKVLAKFVYSLANGIHYLTGVALGQAITIEDLVFNNYPETNISYFDTEEEAGEMASSLVYGTNGVGGLDSVVNTWYDIFMKITLLAYMAFLVYMGIRIMFTSTAEQKAGFKQLFTDWAIGLAILLLFPYAMKYMIKMNAGIVEMVELNKGYEKKSASVVTNIDYSDPLAQIAIDYEIDWSQGSDCMSSIALAVQMEKRLALAITFMIMTWQLIALIVHYYKRLFMTAFLIVIFPLVGLWYAIDKIADGKTQAFNTWLKEFILNVFSQSFHAIVYVFCCSTIYSAGIEGTNGYDYILVIVGVTFLLKGEEIIRQIFGQVSGAGTMKSLSESAVGTFAKFKLAEGAVRFVGENTVGRKSLVNKLYRGTNRLRAVNAKRRAFDKASKTPQEFNDGMRLEHAPTPPPKGASDAEKKEFIKERDLFNAAATLNNPNSHSYAEKAMAFEKLRKQALKDPNHDVFKDTKMTAGQIIAMGDVTKDIQNGIASGKNRVQIERDVTARLGVIFHGESEEKIKEKEKTLYTLLDIKGANDTVKKGDVRREVYSIIREAEDIRDGLYFTSEVDKKEEIAADVMSESFDIYDSYTYSTEEEKEKSRDYAVNVAILKYRNSGYYTEKDILEAAKYVKEHANDNDITTAMAENDLDMDMDMFTHVLAKNVLKTTTDRVSKQIAQEMVDDYEKNPRDGYFDDQVSLHEVVMNMEDTATLDSMIEKVYQNKKDAMTEMTQELGQEYLVDNRVDILENHYDTTTRTLDGLTEGEIEASAIKETSKMLRDIFAINKENATHETGFIFDWWMREVVAKSKEERTGIRRSRDEAIDVLDPTIKGQDFIEKNKKERDRIQSEHFEGDIGDRKDK